MRALKHRESGATTTEYCCIAALLLLLVIPVLAGISFSAQPQLRSGQIQGGGVAGEVQKTFFTAGDAIATTSEGDGSSNSTWSPTPGAGPHGGSEGTAPNPGPGGTGM